MEYKHEGTLRHNSSGRYELEDEYYFTSGEPIEIFVNDTWLKGRIEYSHDHEDYYFLGEHGNIYNLTGMKARI